jgi:hypothetical protein
MTGTAIVFIRLEAVAMLRGVFKFIFDAIDLVARRKGTPNEIWAVCEPALIVAIVSGEEVFNRIILRGER